MTTHAGEKRCGECRWFIRDKSHDWMGSCAVLGGAEPESSPARRLDDENCPAFQSRDAVENHAKLIEAVRNLILDARVLATSASGGSDLEGIEMAEITRKDIAAVEAALKEIE